MREIEELSYLETTKQEKALEKILALEKPEVHFVLLTSLLISFFPRANFAEPPSRDIADNDR